MTWPELLARATAPMGRHPFAFEGRLSRLSYWRSYLRLAAAGAALWVAAVAAILTIGPWGAILFVLYAPLALVVFSVSLRRAHDRGRSVGWWLLVTFGPFAAAMVGELITPANLTALIVVLALSLISLGLSVWGWVEIGFLEGAAGPNRFGPRPS